MNENLQFITEQLIHKPLIRGIEGSQSDLDYLFKSAKSDEHYYFLTQKTKEINIIYSSLDYHNEAVLEIGIDIINHCIQQNKTDIKISKTGENELLIYREQNGTFNNIAIDEDADIEFIHIPANRANTYNLHFPFTLPFSISDLVSKL